MFFETKRNRSTSFFRLRFNLQSIEIEVFCKVISITEVNCMHQQSILHLVEFFVSAVGVAIFV